MNAKKILAGACASLMLAAAAAPVVSAVDSVKVTVDKVEAKAGEKFTVNINLADIPAAGINGCDFGVKYDSKVIKFDEVKLGALAKEDTSLEGVDALVANLDEAGLVSIVYGIDAKADYMKGEGTFLVLTGTVNSDAKPGDKSVLEIVAVDRLENDSENASLNADIIFGALEDVGDGVMYDPTIENGSVTVPGGSTTPTDPTDGPTDGPTEPPTQGPTKPPVTVPIFTGSKDDLKYGDANLDEYVTPADIVAIVKYVVNANAYPLGKGTDETIAKAVEQANVEHDSLIDTKDSAKLKEYILEHITEEDLKK